LYGSRGEATKLLPVFLLYKILYHNVISFVFTAYHTKKKIAIEKVHIIRKKEWNKF